MPGIDYRLLRQQVPLAAVLELAGFVPSRRRGVKVRGPCMLHGSRSRRSRAFAADLGRNIWYCFGCAAGGNALDLWVALHRQPLYAASLDLCRRLGLSVPWLEQRRGSGSQRAPP